MLRTCLKASAAIQRRAPSNRLLVVLASRRRLTAGVACAGISLLYSGSHVSASLSVRQSRWIRWPDCAPGTRSSSPRRLRAVIRS